MTRTAQNRPLFDLDKLKDIKTGVSAPPAPDVSLADEVGERLGFGDGVPARSPAHELQERAERAVADQRVIEQRAPEQRALAPKPSLPPRLDALSPREPVRIAPRDQPAPPPARERVSLQRRLAEASDLVGIRLPVADANRFKLFAARHRLTAGEALTYLLDATGVREDGTLER